MAGVAAPRSRRIYVDGAPCPNGCGGVYRRDSKTARGLCSACHSQERADRIARRAGKTERHPNTVLLWELRREMDAAGKAGLCLYCERRLTPPRLLVCADKQCQRLYGADWKRGRAMLKRAACAAQ